MRGDRARVVDMIEAINEVEKYAAYGKERFLEDELVRIYIVHHLKVVGEAANKLSADLRSGYPNIAWPKILGMRHVLVHDYFRVDYDIVWDVVEKELSALKSHLQTIAEDLKEKPKLDGPQS